jgi:hypothetical protein
MSLLTALAVLDLPTLKKSPFAPKAAVATPNIKASTSARPNTVEAVLPTHTTFEKMVFSISSLLSLGRRIGK